MLLVTLVFWANVSCAHSAGETCGGFAGIKCADDQVCKPHNPEVLDGFGTCIPK